MLILHTFWMNIFKNETENVNMERDLCNVKTTLAYVFKQATRVN